MPLSAAAQSFATDRCAVSARYEPGYGYASVIRMYGSVNEQTTVQVDAAVCTNLIANGWTPQSKYGEWERRNGGAFRPVCGYVWPWGDAVDVYALPGNEGYAWRDCAGFSGGSPIDLTANW
jgi:hypothetical protein